VNKSLADMAAARGAAPSSPVPGDTPDASMTPGEVDEGGEPSPMMGDTPGEPSGEEGSAGGFKKPDIERFIPPEQKDAVDRVVAAGLKMMFSPELRQELMQAVQSEEPAPKVLAENITGLMLTLDQKSGGGGIPNGAIFPAAVKLLGEGAEVMVEAGKPVSQADYNDAALMMFALLGQKMGGTGEQILGVAAESMPGQAAPADPNAPPDAAPQPGMPPAA
jgi:hypothetical protein